MSVAWEHRIVRAHDPRASFFDVLNYEFNKDAKESYYGNFVNQSIVDRMLDRALCRLTGETDATAAMRRLLPYKKGERVFIKINNTTTYELWKGRWDKILWDLHYNDLDAIAEPVNAVLRLLIGMGIPQEMIAVADTTWSEGHPVSENRTPRLTPDRVARKIHAAFPGVVLYRSSYMADGNGVTWASNDQHAIVTFRDPRIERRPQRITSHRISDQVIGAHHFINLPILKLHDRAGISGALKNNFGTIASCAYFHEPQYAGPDVPGATFSDRDNPAVDIWLNPHVGAKTRLIVCDGIFGGWNWGWDPPVGWKNFGGRSPNCLFVGLDPVAMDSVIYDHVQESLGELVKKFPKPGMLFDAAAVGLGRHEHRTAPDAGYRTFEYVELNEPPSDGYLRRMTDLRARYCAGARSAADIAAILAESRGAA